ncbi:glycosyltransferase family 4 protein [Pseudomonas sp. R2.Fl]|nr:glycosyltransferase family 4 protein [Pseudomonas sp. R2.Fl]
MSDRKNRPLRLLQVLEPSGGGSGRHFVDLCGELQQRGHAVTAVYSPVRAEERFVEELHSLGLTRIIPLAMKRAVGPWDAGAWLGLQRIIRDHGPFDVIHGHSSKAGALTRARLPGPHVPRVYTPHAYRTMDPTLGKTGRFLFGTIEAVLGKYFSDRVICVSEDERAHALSLGIPDDRLRVIVNGVRQPPEQDRVTLRQMLDVPPDALVFGFVGRLSAQKACQRLVEAFVMISALVPAAYLVMIGFGEMEADVRSRLDNAGLSDRFRLRHDIPGSMAMGAFDVLTMPSRYEAMSYVMLEAAAAAKPMILTRVGGSANVVDDGLNGVLVPNQDDPSALADAMLAFLDDDRRAGFTAEALRRRDRYALDTMVEQTLAVYRELAFRDADASRGTRRQARAISVAVQTPTSR